MKCNMRIRKVIGNDSLAGERLDMRQIQEAARVLGFNVVDMRKGAVGYEKWEVLLEALVNEIHLEEAP